MCVISAGHKTCNDFRKKLRGYYRKPSYGPDYYESGRQAARLVDKIIKGKNPAEIPVEVNSTIKFAINLKTAKALGLTIPPVVLYQANQVVR